MLEDFQCPSCLHRGRVAVTSEAPVIPPHAIASGAQYLIVLVKRFQEAVHGDATKRTDPVLSCAAVVNIAMEFGHKDAPREGQLVNGCFDVVASVVRTVTNPIGPALVVN